MAGYYRNPNWLFDRRIDTFREYLLLGLMNTEKFDVDTTPHYQFGRYSAMMWRLSKHYVDFVYTLRRA